VISFFPSRNNKYLLLLDVINSSTEYLGLVVRHRKHNAIWGFRFQKTLVSYKLISLGCCPTAVFSDAPYLKLVSGVQS